MAKAAALRQASGRKVLRKEQLKRRRRARRRGDEGERWVMKEGEMLSDPAAEEGVNLAMAALRSSRVKLLSRCGREVDFQVSDDVMKL